MILARSVGAVAAAVAERRDPVPFSAAELLAGLYLDPGAREAILSRLEVSTGCVGDRVAAGELAGVGAHSRDDCPSVAGGEPARSHDGSPRPSVRPFTCEAPVRPRGVERRRRAGPGLPAASWQATSRWSPSRRPRDRQDLVRAGAAPAGEPAAVRRRRVRPGGQVFVPLREVPGAERRSLGAGALLDVDVGGGGRGGAARRQCLRRVGPRAR